jgi:hypothetical protein
MSEDLELLQAIENKHVLEESLDQDDLSVVFSALKGEDMLSIYSAVRIVAASDKGLILNVIEDFASFSRLAQPLLITALASTDFHESYEFLFTLLKDTEVESMSNLIIECLVKTDYFVFPYVLHFLGTKDFTFVVRIKKILLKMGFESLRGYLIMFPELPYENIFRQLFGDKNINELNP